MLYWIRYLCCMLIAATVLFVVGAAFHVAVPDITPRVPPQFENHALFRPWRGWTSTYMLIHPLWFGVVLEQVTWR